MIRQATLIDPYGNQQPLQLRPHPLIVLQGFDFVPAFRDSEIPSPGADGSIDSSRYLDSGSLTVQVAVPSGSRAVLDAIASYMAPWSRPVLTVYDDGWTSPRTLTLRPTGLTRPITAGDGLNRVVQMQWKVPGGAWDSTLSTQTVMSCDGVTSGQPLNSNYDFESSITPWTAYSGAAVLAQSATWGKSGTHALSIHGDGVTANPFAGSELVAIGDPYPAPAGKAYWGSAWLFSVQGTAIAQLGLVWKTAGGVYISTTVGPNVNVPANQAAGVFAFVEGLAPFNAAQAQLIVGMNGTPPATTILQADIARLARANFDVYNPGTLQAAWTASLYGPATGPKLYNDSAGQGIIFTDSLVLADGSQSVALDWHARTAFRNGDPTQSVLGLLDFANSQWWALPPGLNRIRYSASSGQIDTTAAWMWNTPRYL